MSIEKYKHRDSGYQINEYSHSQSMVIIAFLTTEVPLLSNNELFDASAMKLSRKWNAIFLVPRALKREKTISLYHYRK